MILIFAGVLITLYAFFDYKKALMAYLIYQVFWHPTATLLQISGMPTISISMFMNIVFLGIFFLKGSRIRNAKTRFPFSRPIAFIVLSYFITCFFSLAGFAGEFTRALSILAQDYFLLWIMWEVIETKKDMQKLTKGFIIVFLCAGLFSIIEYTIKDNPLVNYKSPLNDAGIVLYSSTKEALTRGYRVVSFFEHPIGAGMTMALFVIYLLCKHVIYNEKIPGLYKYLSYMAGVLCVFGVVFTKMRSCLVFLVIPLLAIVDFRKKRFIKIALALAICLLISFPLFQDGINVILSLFSSKAREAVGGSTLTLRATQFDAIYHLFQMSPIGGLGEKFEELITQSIYTQNALGYESVWFIQMTRHGIVGVLANVYLAYYFIIKLPKLYHSRAAMFLGLGYWITYTITTIPSFRTPLLYLLYFYFLKRTNIYKGIDSTKLAIIDRKTRLLPINIHRRKDLLWL